MQFQIYTIRLSNLRKVKSYSAQYEVISEQPNQNHPNTAKLAPHEYARKNYQNKTKNL